MNAFDNPNNKKAKKGGKGAKTTTVEETNSNSNGFNQADTQKSPILHISVVPDTRSVPRSPTSSVGQTITSSELKRQRP